MSFDVGAGPRLRITWRMAKKLLVTCDPCAACQSAGKWQSGTRSPRSARFNPFFGWEGSPNMDYSKTGYQLILTSKTGGPRVRRHDQPLRLGLFIGASRRTKHTVATARQSPKEGPVLSLRWDTHWANSKSIPTKCLVLLGVAVSGFVDGVLARTPNWLLKTPEANWMLSHVESWARCRVPKGPNVDPR